MLSGSVPASNDVTPEFESSTTPRLDSVVAPKLLTLLIASTKNEHASLALDPVKAQVVAAGKMKDSPPTHQLVEWFTVTMSSASANPQSESDAFLHIISALSCDVVAR